MVSHMNLNHARLPISPHPHIKLFLIIEIDLCVRHSAEPNGRFGERHGAKRSISPLGKFVSMSLPIKLHFRRSWQKR